MAKKLWIYIESDSDMSTICEVLGRKYKQSIIACDSSLEALTDWANKKPYDECKTPTKDWQCDAGFER